MSLHLWTAVSAFVLSAGLTPLVRRLAIRWDIVDHPDGARKLHAGATPLGGGLAIVLAFLVPLAGLLVIPNRWQAELTGQLPFLLGFAAATLLICAVGLVDDRFNLRGRQKLVGQVAAVGVLIGSGLVIRKFTIFEIEVTLGALAIPFTAFWLLGAINALNLIDGVDGLATSIGVVFSAAIAAMALATGHELDGLLTLMLGGSLAGFLIYNFPPARIFLGDSGSMVIGLVLGALAIRSSLKGPATVALAAPAAVWTILIFDVSMAILRRKLTGRSLYTTDRGHLHHTLLSRGASGTQIVVGVGLLCAVCSAGALASLWYQNDLLAVGSAVAVVGVLVLTGLFGRAEVGLLATTLRSFAASFVRLPHRTEPLPRSRGTRLQGDRDWNLLWDQLTDYAESHDLHLVQLNVHIPRLQEVYHAVWDRTIGARETPWWHLTLPLTVNGQAIGELRVAGPAVASGSMHAWLAGFVAGLKPFETRLHELAADQSPPSTATAIDLKPSLAAGIVDPLC